MGFRGRAVSDKSIDGWAHQAVLGSIFVCSYHVGKYHHTINNVSFHAARICSTAWFTAKDEKGFICSHSHVVRCRTALSTRQSRSASSLLAARPPSQTWWCSSVASSCQVAVGAEALRSISRSLLLAGEARKQRSAMFPLLIAPESRSKAAAQHSPWTAPGGHDSSCTIIQLIPTLASMIYGDLTFSSSGSPLQFAMASQKRTTARSMGSAGNLYARSSK